MHQESTVKVSLDQLLHSSELRIKKTCKVRLVQILIGKTYQPYLVYAVTSNNLDSSHLVDDSVWKLNYEYAAHYRKQESVLIQPKSYLSSQYAGRRILRLIIAKSYTNVCYSTRPWGISSTPEPHIRSLEDWFAVQLFNAIVSTSYGREVEYDG